MYVDRTQTNQSGDRTKSKQPETKFELEGR